MLNAFTSFREKRINLMCEFFFLAPSHVYDDDNNISFDKMIFLFELTLIDQHLLLVWYVYNKWCIDIFISH